MSAARHLPPVTLVRQHDTHRLIPSKYNPDLASVLTRIADNDRHLQDLFDLDNATNERLWGENGLLPGIDSHELVFGVPNYHVTSIPMELPGLQEPTAVLECLTVISEQLLLEKAVPLVVFPLRVTK